ncbi:MAG: FkbM family methyltransferase [Alphaproteobacteria bacterium]
MPNAAADTMPASFLGSKDLAAVLERVAPFGCLDIGARGGVVEDIRPLGRAAQVYGFEPDREECARLNRTIDKEPHPFASLRFLPVGLGAREERRALHIMRHAGASSLLPPNAEIAGRFAEHSAYFDVERSIEIETTPLDRVIDEHGVVSPVYMKIDVEGFELEILKGAEQLLDSSLLALRSEVAFLPTRQHQPDFGELAGYLRRFHLMPMGFLYLASWRSLTGVKHPRKVKGPIPYSRGQMVHGDVLFLRDPASLDDGSEAGVKASLRLAFLALLYDYVDVAHDIFKRPAVAAFVHEIIGADGLLALGEASRFLARRHDRRTARVWARNLIKRVTSELKHAFA